MVFEFAARGTRRDGNAESSARNLTPDPRPTPGHLALRRPIREAAAARTIATRRRWRRTSRRGASRGRRRRRSTESTPRRDEQRPGPRLPWNTAVAVVYSPPTRVPARDCACRRRLPRVARMDVDRAAALGPQRVHRAGHARLGVESPVGRPPQQPAAGNRNLPPAGSLVGLGTEAPVGGRIVDELREADRHPAQSVTPRTRLQQQHPPPAVRREPVCEHAARRSRPDDDEIEPALLRHVARPSRLHDHPSNDPPKPWGGGPAMPCALRPAAALRGKRRLLHHSRATPNWSKTGSTETTGSSRAKAWAASARSNGLR